jgi:hypothetical protein
MHALLMLPAIVLGIAPPDVPPASQSGASAQPSPPAISSAPPTREGSELHWTMPMSSGAWSEAQVDD